MSFEVFNIAASGMHAQRIKMDTVSSNIANVNTTRNEFGEKEVYHKKQVNFKQMAIEKGFNFPQGNVGVEFDPPEKPYLVGSVSMDANNIASGVMVDSIVDADNPTKIIYDPSHPDADDNGYVEVPNINVVEEMVNMVNASRAYEANVTIAQTTKAMIQSAINI
ncbi:MAG: flagellar basal body rod protein FlgC [Candidatus Gastranaerophilales bacterium]|nr:flagellar basal body rod protein FlgC [Candidatus Gastranaerophilales bacterium]